MTPQLYGGTTNPHPARARKSSLEKTAGYLADRFGIDADGYADIHAYARRLGIGAQRAAVVLRQLNAKLRPYVHGNRGRSPVNAGTGKGQPTPPRLAEAVSTSAAAKDRMKAEHADCASAVLAWLRDGRGADTLEAAIDAVEQFHQRWGRHVHAGGYGWRVGADGWLAKFKLDTTRSPRR